MTSERTFGTRWAEYRPSKTALFWSWVAIAVLTMVVGFAWGGWVTGGTAQDMVTEGRRDLAAAFCVQQFLASPDASAKHAALMKEGSWHRNSFVEKGGWAKMPKLEHPITGVADLCAEKLAAIEVPPAAAQTESDSSKATTTIQ